MTFSIPANLQQELAQEVAGGGYASEAEVIAEALRLLRARDRQLEALRAEVAVGVEDSRARRVGEYSAGEICRIARERRDL